MCRYVRWTAECIITSETRARSDAWKMPPNFYKSPMDHSSLLRLHVLSFQELYAEPGFHDRMGLAAEELSNENLSIICSATSDCKLLPIYYLNVRILLHMGIAVRLFAFALMCTMNRQKMGLRA